MEKWRSRARSAYDWYGHSQSAAPLISGALGGGTMGVIQFLAEQATHLIAVWALLTGVALTVIWRFLPAGLARVLALIGLVGVASILIIRGYWESLQYEVEFTDYNMAMGRATTTPSGPPAAEWMQFGLAFSNPNSFKVDGLSIRRYVSVANVVSGDDGHDDTFTMPEKTKLPSNVIDSTIIFPGPWKLNASEPGTIDYAICFRRHGQSEYDKMYRMKGRLYFIREATGAFGKPRFIAASPKEENHGFYDGCAR